WGPGFSRSSAAHPAKAGTPTPGRPPSGTDSESGGRRLQRMETMMMPANFSSMVGEFIITATPKRCRTLVRNEYHTAHPDRAVTAVVTGEESLMGRETARER